MEERGTMKKIIEKQILHLYLDGELDMNNADSLRKAIDYEIDKKGVKTVVLHLNDLKFIDSSGIGVIIGRYKKLLPLGGQLKITEVPSNIYKILEMSGLPKIIKFYTDNIV